MEVLNFMNANKNWREILAGEPYNITIKDYNGYTLLKYNQLSSDFSLPIVRESRGAIFYQRDDGSYECVCRAFDKFMNYNQDGADKIDWASAVVEEKIDGCFSGYDCVMLADGTARKIKTIVNNKENVYVLSYNFDTKTIEPKKVIGWNKSVTKRPSSDWLTIHLKRIKTKLKGKFSQHCVITPTRNHQFFVKRNGVIQEILAENLNVGDILLTPIVGLTEIEKQVILGTLLGDGSCTYYQEQDKTRDKGIRFCHSRKQEEYVKFKASLLQRLGGQVKNIVASNSYGKEKTQYQSLVNSGISLCYNVAYKNYHKQVSYEWLQQLGWLGFAIWYMDDGSLQTGCKNNSIHLHTEGYTKDEVELICKFYTDKGYKSYVQHYKEYYIINFSTEASELIWKEIRKFIPECMQYKLPERHRGFFEEIIDTEVPKMILSEGYIEKIDNGLTMHNPYKEDSIYSYDIEVEDNHNYFCQGALVHNSLIKMWHHNNQWRIATNGTIDAFTAEATDTKSYGDLVVEALGGLDKVPDFCSILDKNYTYMFELVSPETQLIVSYPETKLYFLGRRNIVSMREDKEKPNYPGIRAPKQYPLSSIDECLAYVKTMTKDEEGFVVRDKYFRRIKIKSPEYLIAFGANNNNRITEKRIIRMLKNNTIDDFLAYCPQHKAKVDDVLSRIFAICAQLEDDWATNQPVSSRKEFALRIKNLKTKGFLFCKYDDPSLKAIDYILSLFTKTILRFLEEFKV